MSSDFQISMTDCAFSAARGLKCSRSLALAVLISEMVIGRKLGGMLLSSGSRKIAFEIGSELKPGRLHRLG